MERVLDFGRGEVRSSTRGTRFGSIQLQRLGGGKDAIAEDKGKGRIEKARTGKLPVGRKKQARETVERGSDACPGDGVRRAEFHKKCRAKRKGGERPSEAG